MAAPRPWHGAVDSMHGMQDVDACLAHGRGQAESVLPSVPQAAQSQAGPQETTLQS